MAGDLQTVAAPDGRLHAQPVPQGGLPLLCLAGRGGRPAPLRDTALGWRGGVVRRRRRPGARRRVGREDPPPGQGVRPFHRAHLREHPGPRGGIFPDRVGLGRGALPGDRLRGGVHSARGDRRHQGAGRPGAGPVPRRPVDPPARRERAARHPCPLPEALVAPRRRGEARGPAGRRKFAGFTSANAQVRVEDLCPWGGSSGRAGAGCRLVAQTVPPCPCTAAHGASRTRLRSPDRGAPAG